MFRLYSIGYVDHCYSSGFGLSKYVELYYLDENDPFPYDQKPSDSKTEQIHGHMYFNANSGCDFGLFCPPKHVSLEEYRLKSGDGEYELTVQFLSNTYLKLTVSRELVIIDKFQPPPAPEVSEFVGIHYNKEKEVAKRKRSPSPRESCFKMNHPMGSWNQR